MLTYRQLIELERSSRDRMVLSIYINGEVKDPADRRRWRLDLRHAFDDIELWLDGSSPAERASFALCRERVVAELESYSTSVRAPGWAGFFSPDGALHTSVLPVPVQTMAVWSTGLCVTPYIRALEEAVPVIVALADARTVRLYRYADRKAELVDTVHAHVAAEVAVHMGQPPRLGFHSGTRGASGTDESQRELREGTAHMLAEVAERLAKLATDHASVVLGGIESVAKAALARLTPEVAGRATCAAIDVHATTAEVEEAARAAAAMLRNEADLQRVNDAITAAERRTRGVTGSHDTRRALELKLVRDLFFTTSFLEDHAADAESAVRLAFDNGAHVEHVSGSAAERLEHVGGIAARLWYQLATGNNPSTDRYRSPVS